MLKIDNLHATVAGREILKGLSLDVKPGEVHASCARPVLSQVLDAFPC